MPLKIIFRFHWWRLRILIQPLNTALNLLEVWNSMKQNMRQSSSGWTEKKKHLSNCAQFSFYPLFDFFPYFQFLFVLPALFIYPCMFRLSLSCLITLDWIFSYSTLHYLIWSSSGICLLFFKMCSCCDKMVGRCEKSRKTKVEKPT